jgi:hypothetical protein
MHKPVPAPLASQGCIRIHRWQLPLATRRPAAITDGRHRSALRSTRNHPGQQRTACWCRPAQRIAEPPRGHSTLGNRKLSGRGTREAPPGSEIPRSVRGGLLTVFSGQSLATAGPWPSGGMQQAGCWTRPDLPFWCGAPQETNRRPHPHHGTTGNRCADRHFPSSRATVGAEVIGALSAKLCTHSRAIC